MLKLEVSYRGLTTIALGLLGLWLLVQLWPVFIIVLTSFIFMAAFQPYVTWLERRGVGRTTAVLLMLLAVLTVLAGMLVLVVPAIINEFNHLRQDLPADARSLDAFLARFDINTDLESRARNVDWSTLVSGRAAVSYGEQALFTVISILSVVVITVYLLIDVRRLENFIFQFVPPGREPELVQILQSLSRVVGGYIRGQFITSAIIALYTLVVCLAAGVPNPVAFGVIAAIADSIPIAGSFLSIAPATSAALRESPTQAVIVFALLLLYHQFEDRFLVPRVYARTLNLPPLIVLVAVLAGGELLGISGVLLALPAAAAARVALDYYLDRRRALAGTPAEPRDEVLAPD
jgi:putative heme transporter